MNRAYQTLEAFVDVDGSIKLVDSVSLPVGKRVLVTILDEVTRNVVAVPVTVKSRYRILEYLGGGGMGETYKAENIENGSIVCIKKLRPNYSNSIFLQECKAISRLNHPSIVRFLDIEDSQEPLLIMEFVDGIRLDYFIKNQVIPETIVVDIGYQLFQALEEAHNNQIIHCDIKPANIILQRSNTLIIPKILDFGLAIVDRYDDKLVETGLGRIAGTPLYMAPEQFEGDILSGACDVYALGLILGEMLTGEPIFIEHSNNYNKLMIARRNQNTGIRLRNLPLKVSSSLINLIEHCTHPKPEQRCTAHQAVAVLKTLKSSIPVDCVLAPINFQFQVSSFESIPFGWSNSKNYVDNVSNNYSIQVVSDSTNSTYIQIQSNDASSSEFGSIMQRCPANYLSRRRIRLEGNLQAENALQWCGLWLRIDDNKKAVFFDNMHDRAISGTTQSKTVAIEVDVPEDCVWLNYGVILVGQGTVLVNNLRLLWLRENNWVTIDMGLEMNMERYNNYSSVLLT